MGRGRALELFAATLLPSISSLLGGRVIDPESGLDAVRHVGIKAGKIVMLSEAPLTGAPTLDAAGLVVAPASSTCIRTR
jgi:predicted amidohydrolase